MLSGKLSVVCYYFYFLPFDKALWHAQSKDGEENKLSQREVSHSLAGDIQFAPGSADDQRHFLSLWGRMLFRVHFLSFRADQSLCYHEEQRWYIKQKLHQLEVLYLHKTWSLHFLIPSTGFLHSQVSADVTIVVFKCMITPVPYLISSCLLLMTSGLFAWGFGIAIKALSLQKSQKTRTE